MPFFQSTADTSATTKADDDQIKKKAPMTCGNHSKRKGKLAVCFPDSFIVMAGRKKKRNIFFLPQLPGRAKPKTK